MKIVHTMIRVGNLEKSLDFYTRIMGMKILKKTDYPQGKFTLVFVGFSEDKDAAAIELTYNYGVEKYTLGNAFGHIAIAVDNVVKACAEIKERGGNITYGPAEMGGGGTSIIAFVEDPDGYEIELVTKK